MKNILFIHHGGDQVRGTEATLISLLQEMDLSKFNPIVLCNNEIFLNELKSLSVQVEKINIPEIMFDGRDIRLPLVKYISTLKSLYKYCINHRIDIIYSSGGLPCQLGVPLSKFLNIPIICHFHHPAPKRYYYIWLVKYVTKVIFPSQFTALHSLKKANIKGVVIHNGVDNINSFAPVINKNNELRKKLGFDDSDVIFAQVGNISKHKGVDTLITCFEKVIEASENAKLIIIGDGPERKPLEELVESKNLQDKIKFLGYVESLIPYTRHVIDINVLASKEEGLGLVLIQASACGIPNIGTNGTGIKEAVIHGKTGFLFNSAGEFIDYMVQLAKDKDLRKAMGNNGVSFVNNGFSNFVYASRIQNEILSTCNVN